METKKLDVVSLFDGVSMAYLALKKAGVNFNNYYSSEIDKHCLKVQRHHYGKDKHFIKLGDVRTVDAMQFSDNDILAIAGSPCLQLSSINIKDRSGLSGKDSKLFHEFARVLLDLKFYLPTGSKLWVLFENVASMPNAERDKITAKLKAHIPDIKLIKIDSALLTSTHRRRYYWTNLPVTEPEPIKANFQDILVDGYTDREKANVILSTNVTQTNGIFRYYKRNIGNIIFKDKDFADLPTDEKLKLYPEILKASGYNAANKKKSSGEYEYLNGCYRLPSIKEYSRMMTVPDDYLDSVPKISPTAKLKMLGQGFSVDVIAHLLAPLKDKY